MGVSTSGDIQIELQTVEDAEYVCAQLSKMKELAEARLKIPCHFNLTDEHVDGTVVNCNVYSSRIPNGEFQIEQVVEQLKIWVKEGKLKPPYQITGELMVCHESYYFDEDTFLPEGK